MKRIFRIVGRRGTFLLFLWMLDWVYAFSLIFPTRVSLGSPILMFVSSLRLPLLYWGILWAIIGLICLIYAFKDRDAPAYGASMFLKSLWATMSLFGWIAGYVERGYLAAAIWGAFAALVWVVSTWPDSYREKG